MSFPLLVLFVYVLRPFRTSIAASQRAYAEDDSQHQVSVLGLGPHYINKA